MDATPMQTRRLYEIPHPITDQPIILDRLRPQEARRRNLLYRVDGLPYRWREVSSEASRASGDDLAQTSQNLAV